MLRNAVIFAFLVLTVTLVTFAAFNFKLNSEFIAVLTQAENNNQLTRKPTEAASTKNKKLNINFLGIDISQFPYVDRWGEYFEALGIRKYGTGNSFQNSGLAEFNQNRFSQNSCFAKLAAYFYDDIKRKDFDFYSKHTNILQSPLEGRPALNQKLGVSDYSEIRPGWLWSLARSYANGNATLAFQLIGVCGHDDRNQGVTFPDLPEQADSVTRSYRKAYRSIRELRMQAMSYEQKQCPWFNSLMFVQGSLGASAQVEEQMKSWVAQVQAPTKGPSYLPSKYYHTIGAAFSSCLALQRCPNNILCSYTFNKGQTFAVSAYRAKTLCESMLDTLDNLKEDPSNETVASDAATVFFRISPSLKENCGLADSFRHVESTLDNADTKYCASDWTVDRCQKSLAKLKTYKVDFEWSRAAHQAGYEFAKQNCPALDEKVNSLDYSCEALKVVEQSLGYSK